MLQLRAVSIAISICGLAAAPLAAKDKETDQAAPKIFQDVVDCLKIETDADRLACYDRSVASLESAQREKELYVADKEEVKKSRKGLFGFTLSNIGIFGGSNSDEDQVDSIEAVIKSVREASGKYVLTLEDGAVWAQTEYSSMGLTPKPGHKIAIKRGAMGSYIGKIENGRTFRMKRLNN